MESTSEFKSRQGQYFVPMSRALSTWLLENSAVIELLGAYQMEVFVTGSLAILRNNTLIFYYSNCDHTNIFTFYVKIKVTVSDYTSGSQNIQAMGPFYHFPPSRDPFTFLPR